MQVAYLTINLIYNIIHLHYTSSFQFIGLRLMPIMFDVI